MATSRLTKMDLFATPESVKALEQYVQNLSNDGERAVAIVVMGMTWNLCSELTKQPS